MPEYTFNVGDVAPDFELLSDPGEPVRLSQFRGKAVLRPLGHMVVYGLLGELSICVGLTTTRPAGGHRRTCVGEMV